MNKQKSKPCWLIRRKYSLRFRLTAILLTLLMVGEASVFASYEKADSRSLSAPGYPFFQSSLHDFLGDEARVKETIEGQGQGTVYVIQDAHAFASAQKQIAKVIDLLTENEGIRLVNIEGASEEIDHRLLSMIPDEPTRDLIADYFLNESYLTASEYLAITKRPGLILSGIEDPFLYRENRSVFLDVRKNFSRISKSLEMFNRLADEVARYRLSEAALAIKRAKDHLNEGGFAFEHYVLALHETAGQAGIDLSAFKRLNLLTEGLSQRNESQFNETLEKILTVRGKEDQDLVQSVQQWRNGQLGVSAFRDVLREDKDRNSAMQQDFELLDHYLSDLYALEQTGPVVLEELQSAEDLIMQKILSPQEELCWEKLKDASLIQKAASLRLTYEEWREFSTLIHQKGLDAVRTYFEETGRLFHMDALALKNWQEMADHLDQVMHFYELAEKRNQGMVHNTIRNMKNQGVDKSVMVAGGFHGQGVMREFEKSGYRVALIEPRITGAVNENKIEKLYDRAMKREFAFWAPLTLSPSFSSIVQAPFLNTLAFEPYLPSRTDVVELERLLSAVDLDGAWQASVTHESWKLVTTAALLARGYLQRVLGKSRAEELLNRMVTNAPADIRRQAAWFQYALAGPSSQTLPGNLPDEEYLIGTDLGGDTRFVIRASDADTAHVKTGLPRFPGMSYDLGGQSFWFGFVPKTLLPHARPAGTQFSGETGDLEGFRNSAESDHSNNQFAAVSESDQTRSAENTVSPSRVPVESLHAELRSNATEEPLWSRFIPPGLLKQAHTPYSPQSGDGVDTGSMRRTLINGAKDFFHYMGDQDLLKPGRDAWQSPDYQFGSIYRALVDETPAFEWREETKGSRPYWRVGPEEGDLGSFKDHHEWIYEAAEDLSQGHFVPLMDRFYEPELVLNKFQRGMVSMIGFMSRTPVLKFLLRFFFEIILLDPFADVLDNIRWPAVKILINALGLASLKMALFDALSPREMRILDMALAVHDIGKLVTMGPLHPTIGEEIVPVFLKAFEGTGADILSENEKNLLISLTGLEIQYGTLPFGESSPRQLLSELDKDSTPSHLFLKLMPLIYVFDSASTVRSFSYPRDFLNRDGVMVPKRGALTYRTLKFPYRLHSLSSLRSLVERWPLFRLLAFRQPGLDVADFGNLSGREALSHTESVKTILADANSEKALSEMSFIGVIEALRLVGEQSPENQLKWVYLLTTLYQSTPNIRIVGHSAFFSSVERLQALLGEFPSVTELIRKKWRLQYDNGRLSILNETGQSIGYFDADYDSTNNALDIMMPSWTPLHGELRSSAPARADVLDLIRQIMGNPDNEPLRRDALEAIRLFQLNPEASAKDAIAAVWHANVPETELLDDQTIETLRQNLERVSVIEGMRYLIQRGINYWEVAPEAVESDPLNEFSGKYYQDKYRHTLRVWSFLNVVNRAANDQTAIPQLTKILNDRRVTSQDPRKFDYQDSNSLVDAYQSLTRRQKLALFLSVWIHDYGDLFGKVMTYDTHYALLDSLRTGLELDRTAQGNQMYRMVSAVTANTGAYGNLATGEGSIQNIKMEMQKSGIAASEEQARGFLTISSLLAIADASSVGRGWLEHRWLDNYLFIAKSAHFDQLEAEWPEARLFGSMISGSEEFWPLDDQWLLIDLPKHTKQPESSGQVADWRSLAHEASSPENVQAEIQAIVSKPEAADALRRFLQDYVLTGVLIINRFSGKVSKLSVLRLLTALAIAAKHFPDAKKVMEFKVNNRATETGPLAEVDPLTGFPLLAMGQMETLNYILERLNLDEVSEIFSHSTPLEVLSSKLGLGKNGIRFTSTGEWIVDFRKLLTIDEYIHQQQQAELRTLPEVSVNVDEYNTYLKPHFLKASQKPLPEILEELKESGKLFEIFPFMGVLDSSDHIAAQGVNVFEQMLRSVRFLWEYEQGQDKDVFTDAFADIASTAQAREAAYLTALLFDAGKVGPPAGHEIRGAQLLRPVFESLGINADLMERMLWVIERHGFLGEISYGEMLPGFLYGQMRDVSRPEQERDLKLLALINAADTHAWYGRKNPYTRWVSDRYMEYIQPGYAQSSDPVDHRLRSFSSNLPEEGVQFNAEKFSELEDELARIRTVVGEEAYQSFQKSLGERIVRFDYSFPVFERLSGHNLARALYLLHTLVLSTGRESVHAGFTSASRLAASTIPVLEERLDAVDDAFLKTAGQLTTEVLIARLAAEYGVSSRYDEENHKVIIDNQYMAVTPFQRPEMRNGGETTYEFTDAALHELQVQYEAERGEDNSFGREAREGPWFGFYKQQYMMQKAMEDPRFYLDAASIWASVKDIKTVRRIISEGIKNKRLPPYLFVFDTTEEPDKVLMRLAHQQRKFPHFRLVPIGIVTGDVAGTLGGSVYSRRILKQYLEKLGYRWDDLKIKAHFLVWGSGGRVFPMGRTNKITAPAPITPYSYLELNLWGITQYLTPQMKMAAEPGHNFVIYPDSMKFMDHEPNTGTSFHGDKRHDFQFIGSLVPHNQNGLHELGIANFDGEGRLTTFVEKPKGEVEIEMRLGKGTKFRSFGDVYATDRFFDALEAQIWPFIERFDGKLIDDISMHIGEAWTLADARDFRTSTEGIGMRLNDWLNKEIDKVKEIAREYPDVDPKELKMEILERIDRLKKMGFVVGVNTGGSQGEFLHSNNIESNFLMQLRIEGSRFVRAIAGLKADASGRFISQDSYLGPSVIVEPGAIVMNSYIESGIVRSGSVVRNSRLVDVDIESGALVNDVEQRKGTLRVPAGFYVNDIFTKLVGHQWEKIRYVRLVNQDINEPVNIKAIVITTGSLRNPDRSFNVEALQSIRRILEQPNAPMIGIVSHYDFPTIHDLLLERRDASGQLIIPHYLRKKIVIYGQNGATATTYDYSGASSSPIVHYKFKSPDAQALRAQVEEKIRAYAGDEFRLLRSYDAFISYQIDDHEALRRAYDDVREAYPRLYITIMDNQLRISLADRSAVALHLMKHVRIHHQPGQRVVIIGSQGGAQEITPEHVVMGIDKGLLELAEQPGNAGTIYSINVNSAEVDNDGLSIAVETAVDGRGNIATEHALEEIERTLKSLRTDDPVLHRGWRVIENHYSMQDVKRMLSEAGAARFEGRRNRAIKRKKKQQADAAKSELRRQEMSVLADSSIAHPTVSLNRSFAVMDEMKQTQPSRITQIEQTAAGSLSRLVGARISKVSKGHQQGPAYVIARWREGVIDFEELQRFMQQLPPMSRLILLTEPDQYERLLENLHKEVRLTGQRNIYVSQTSAAEVIRKLTEGSRKMYRAEDVVKLEVSADALRDEIYRMLWYGSSGFVASGRILDLSQDDFTFSGIQRLEMDTSFFAGLLEDALSREREKTLTGSAA